MLQIVQHFYLQYQMFDNLLFRQNNNVIICLLHYVMFNFYASFLEPNALDTRAHNPLVSTLLSLTINVSQGVPATANGQFPVS